MQHTVLFFGQLTELTAKVSISVEAVDINSLLAVLEEGYPDLRKQKFAIAVNKKIVEGNIDLKTESTVALLPPFSGG